MPYKYESTRPIPPLASTPREDDLMTIEEVVARLRISLGSVRRFIRDGRLRSVRIGGKLIRFRRADVEALIQPRESSHGGSEGGR
jgi:excisionase family DNA binding protein